MIENLREDWRLFKSSKPGFRFRDRYRRRQRRSGPGGFDFRKALYVFVGLVVAVVSLLMAPLPGPGWGTFFVGLLILAGELLVVARLLDRVDATLRGPARVGRSAWASLPGWLRTLIGVAAPICGAALALWVLLSVLG